MVGQFDTFHGGLNLVGAPWDRNTFHLSQAVAMSNCDVTAGGLQGERGHDILFQMADMSAPKSLIWNDGDWLASSNRRSYSRYNDSLCYSVDFIDYETPHGTVFLANENGGFSTVGVPAPNAQVYDGLEATRANVYRINVNSSPGGDRNCYVTRQQMIVASTITLDGFKPGDWICAVNQDNSLEWSRIVGIDDYPDGLAAITDSPPEGALSVKKVTVSHWNRFREYTFDATNEHYLKVVIVPTGVARHPDNGITVLIYPVCGFGTDDYQEQSGSYSTFWARMHDSVNFVFAGYVLVEFEASHHVGMVAPEDLLYTVPIGAGQNETRIVQASQSENNRSLGVGECKYVLTYVDSNGNEGPAHIPGSPRFASYRSREAEDRNYQQVDVSYVIGQSSITWISTQTESGWGGTFRGTAAEVQAKRDEIEAGIGVVGSQYLYAEITDVSLAPASFESTARYVPLPYADQGDNRGPLPRPNQAQIQLPNACLAQMGEGWKLRLYRTNAGGETYFLVKQFSRGQVESLLNSGDPILDGLEDLTLIGNPPLTSTDNHGPVFVKEDGVWLQQNLSLLTAHAGRFFGVYNRRLYWSAAGNIHVWPISQWKAFQSDIKALVSLHDELLIIGETWVARLRGRTLGTFAFESIPTTLGVTSPDLVSVISGSAFWVNAAGICRYSGYNVDLVSRPVLGKEYPYSDIAFVTSYYDDFLGLTRTGEWLIYRLGSVPVALTGSFDTHSVSCVAKSPDTGLPVAIFPPEIGIGHAVVQLFSGDRESFSFTTGVDHGGMPGVLKHFTRVTVQSDGDVEVVPIIDGVEHTPIALESGRVQEYLDNGARGYGIQFRISGHGPLRLVRYYAQEQEDR